MGPLRWKHILAICVILWLNVALSCSGSKIIRTSAKTLAERAGAAQYAVHIEEELNSAEVNSKHDVRKRLTDDNHFDDSDYEIYQGVVGRPGIDFPILAGIPQTTFNCRRFGNGYFADLETECQVFHICEGGKKISFLCPNGTIFQQAELICDWWFRVNCAASPGHYAESSEILSRARHRYRLDKNRKTKYNINGGVSLNQNHYTTNDKPQKDQYELREDASVENFDFEDIIGSVENTNKEHDKQGSTRNPKDLSRSTGIAEIQQEAESSSFVKPSNNDFNGYNYRNPNNAKSIENNVKYPTPQTGQENDTTNNNSYDSVIASRSNSNQGYTGTTKEPSTIFITTTPTTRRGSVTYYNQKTAGNRQNRKQSDLSYYTTPNSLGLNEIKTTVTPSIVLRKRPSTYTTARKIETSRTTPFYTPTVPSIIVRPTIVNSATYAPQNAFSRSTTQRSTAVNTVSSSINAQSEISEHAVEMMKTLQVLNITADAGTTSTTNLKEMVSGSRAGLIIPPSSGPDTLHSLALYFATAVDNLVTKPETTTAFEKSLNIEFGNVTKISSTLVSNETVQKYEQLFGISSKSNISHVDVHDENLSTNIHTSDSNDLETEYSNNPILAAAGSPQIRELAQVFTHALSAYLHDPTTFRRVLSEIRPTEPTHVDKRVSKSRIGESEDFNKGTGPTYLPSVATTPVSSSITDDLEVLDFSDVTISTGKKKEGFSTTIGTTVTEQPEWTSTTSPTTTSYYSTTLDSMHNSLIHADRTPASRYLTDKLKNRESKLLRGTTDNPIAMEINSGLIVSTSIPYFQDYSLESTNKIPTDNYFPLDSGEQTENFTFNPYGHGVKPLNSTPINTSFTGFTSDFSSVTTTTEYPSGPSVDLLPPNHGSKGFVLPTHEILPPTVDENDLQRAQSQSILSGKNQLLSHDKERSFVEVSTASPTTDFTTTIDPISTINPVKGHYITHSFATSTLQPELSQRTTIPDIGKFSPNPWSTLAYTVFLDPLTINDGLIDSNGHKTVTPSPNTYLPRSTQTTPYEPVTTTESPIPFIVRGPSGSNTRKSKTLSSLAKADRTDEYMEMMQQKANAMFGGLNDTSAYHLMNVMKKANKNKTVRKLILLLIQTCDDDDNISVEESRTALLNALIGMDGKLDDNSELQVIRPKTGRRGKSISEETKANSLHSSSSTTEVPITTYHRPYTNIQHNNSGEIQSNSNENVQSTLTPHLTDDNPSTAEPLYDRTSTYDDPTVETTTLSAATSNVATEKVTILPQLVKEQRQRESRRIAKDVDDLIGQHSHSYNDDNRVHKHSDARALDLLRSLYSLAGRFGKR